MVQWGLWNIQENFNYVLKDYLRCCSILTKVIKYWQYLSHHRQPDVFNNHCRAAAIADQSVPDMVVAY